MPIFRQRLLTILLSLTLMPAPVLAAPVSPPATAVTASGRPFRASDEVEILVITNPESMSGLTQRAMLGEDGIVVMPLIGNIQVTGKTPAELTQTLTAAFKRYFSFVFVGVQLSRPAPGLDVVYVTQNKGTTTVTVPNGRALSLAEVIGRSGGITDQSDGERITIYRSGGGQEVVDFQRGLVEGTNGRVTLYPGDTVRIPPNWLGVIASVTAPIQSVMGIIGMVTLAISVITIFRPGSTP